MLTQDKTTGRERFQISMDVVMPQQLPEDGAEEEQADAEESADEATASDETANDAETQAGEGDVSE